jgi:hypothetical protein
MNGVVIGAHFFIWVKCYRLEIMMFGIFADLLVAFDIGATWGCPARRHFPFRIFICFMLFFFLVFCII